jgi:hypothetical protein
MRTKTKSNENSLKIPKQQSDSVNGRIDNRKATRKQDKRPNNDLQNSTQKSCLSFYFYMLFFVGFFFVVALFVIVLCLDPDIVSVS